MAAIEMGTLVVTVTRCVGETDGKYPWLVMLMGVGGPIWPDTDGLRWEQGLVASAHNSEADALACIPGPWRTLPMIPGIKHNDMVNADDYHTAFMRIVPAMAAHARVLLSDDDDDDTTPLAPDDSPAPPYFDPADTL